MYQVVDALDEVAAETGKTVPQIALNWLLQRPTVATVIIGARNEEQLRQNLGAIGWNLSPEHVAAPRRRQRRPPRILTGTSTDLPSVILRPCEGYYLYPIAVRWSGLPKNPSVSEAT